MGGNYTIWTINFSHIGIQNNLGLYVVYATSYDMICNCFNGLEPSIYSKIFWFQRNHETNYYDLFWN